MKKTVPLDQQQFWGLVGRRSRARSTLDDLIEQLRVAKKRRTPRILVVDGQVTRTINTPGDNIEQAEIRPSNCWQKTRPDRTQVEKQHNHRDSADFMSEGTLETPEDSTILGDFKNHPGNLPRKDEVPRTPQLDGGKGTRPIFNQDDGVAHNFILKTKRKESYTTADWKTPQKALYDFGNSNKSRWKIADNADENGKSVLQELNNVKKDKTSLKQVFSQAYQKEIILATGPATAFLSRNEDTGSLMSAHPIAVPTTLAESKKRDVHVLNYETLPIKEDSYHRNRIDASVEELSSSLLTGLGSANAPEMISSHPGTSTVKSKVATFGNEMNWQISTAKHKNENDPEDPSKIVIRLCEYQNYFLRKKYFFESRHHKKPDRAWSVHLANELIGDEVLRKLGFNIPHEEFHRLLGKLAFSGKGLRLLLVTNSIKATLAYMEVIHNLFSPSLFKDVGELRTVQAEIYEVFCKFWREFKFQDVVPCDKAELTDSLNFLSSDEHLSLHTYSASPNDPARNAVATMMALAWLRKNYPSFYENVHTRPERKSRKSQSAPLVRWKTWVISCIHDIALSHDLVRKFIEKHTAGPNKINVDRNKEIFCLYPLKKLKIEWP